MEADFSGYATKAGLKCSDGRTIMPNAFEHQDNETVPLVWAHSHGGPTNVLGHAILENRDSSHPEGAGTYTYGYFNDSPQGLASKELVKHGDITWLSIYANQLIERSKQVFHGAIREVSLVLAGANPGARIDFVSVQHSADPDDVTNLEDEAVIFTGLALQHSATTVEPEVEVETEEVEVETEEEEVVEHADNNDGATVQDVYESFTEVQKEVVHFMIGAALEANADVKHSDIEIDDKDNKNEDNLTHQEGTEDMSRNVFDRSGTGTKSEEGPSLSHDQLATIVADAKKSGSFKEAFLAHAAEYGITDIDILFPDAKNLTARPELIARRVEWVAGVIDGAKHSPFARIKSIVADLTAEEARARGYVKGNMKKDEVIRLLKRVTTPKMIYKKQKLDREDIIDITDLDVVAWLKWEMRFMLEEELARAILIGDGREPDDEDKIDEDYLRPIAWDDEMYSHPVTVPSNASSEAIVEAVIRARKNYKGTGRPVFYTTDDIITDLLLIKDKMGRFVYDDEANLAAKLRVSQLIPVEVMETEPDLLGIMVNMQDYTIGADKGGELSMFDDFDIDYNQYKYLIETRISGALTKPKAAVVIKRTSGTTVTPLVPAFDEETNTITVPTVTGVHYFNTTNPLSEVALTNGADVVITETTDVEARPDSGYNFPHNTDADWVFSYTA